MLTGRHDWYEVHFIGTLGNEVFYMDIEPDELISFVTDYLKVGYRLTECRHCHCDYGM